MKSELLHLLHKLKAEHPDAQNIVISIHGAPIAVTLQHTVRRFESLDALEAYAWPQENVGSSNLLARLPGEGSAQDARAASALECGEGSPLSLSPQT